MSQYPPPPVPEQSQYNPIYADITNVDPAMQGQYQANVLKHNLTEDLQPRYTLGQIEHDYREQEPRPAAHMQSRHRVEQESVKSNRLRKACDSCSVRKVKCDESGPPCRACAALDIPCTFSRPTKRRGPPNRHAAALKRQRLEASYTEPLSPASPTNAAQALAALSAQTSHVQNSAESICPLDTLDLLINDFFAYIHPLCPFPHEPSFRDAWERREDLTNKSFLALLASMIGALVASFPRKPRLHLKAQRKEKLFPNHMSLVRTCQQVCAAARGPNYLENDRLSVYDAATSYFLALMGTYTFRWRQGRLYFAECLTIIRVLGLHKADMDMSGQPLGALPNLLHDGEATPKDNITLQIGRRIFWTMFVSVKTLQQLGAEFDELQIPPPTPTSPYPPLPLEIDDFYIHQSYIEPQPAGILSIIAGFNANVHAFSSYTTLSTMELAWGIDHIVDWERQKKVLKESLRKCKDATALLPHELKVELQNMSSDGGRAQLYTTHPNRDQARSLLSLAGVHEDDLLDQTSDERRHMQYEIQKANVYASTLATRSYIVQKYWNLVEAHARSRTQLTTSRPTSPHSPSVGIVAAGIDGALPSYVSPTSNFDMTDQEFRDERELIMKDLLIVLSSIDQVNMEPNADSFTMKIRAIASTLLDTPDSGRGHTEVQAKEYLSAFLDILIRLERTNLSDEPSPAGDEAAALKEWANLREYQIKFAQQGGFDS